MRIMSSGFGNLSGCLCKTMKMTGYEDQDSGPCICLGLFFGRRQIQDEGQWERQFCPFGTITTRAEQSRWPGLKAPIRHLWLMSSSRPFWSKQQKVKWHGHRWTQMPLHRHLNCSWGALASPLPVCWHSSGSTQPLGAALEREATNCFSKESSSAGEKQLPSHRGLEWHWTANHVQVQVQVVTCSWQKSN